jgi:hypothetical protein
MKNIFLMLAAGIVFSLSSCNSGDVGTDDAPDTYANGLDANSPEQPPALDDSEGKADNSHLPVIIYHRLRLDFTVDEVESFNATTGEIVFANSICEKLTKPSSYHTDAGTVVEVYDTLSLYYDDKPLFEGIKLTNMASSNMVDELVFIYDPRIYGKDEAKSLDTGVYRYINADGDIVEPVYYLADGYPIFKDGGNVSRVERDGRLLEQDDIQRLRDENFKKRKPEWDIFIKYLRDAGKIVEE